LNETASERNAQQDQSKKRLKSDSSSISDLSSEEQDNFNKYESIAEKFGAKVERRFENSQSNKFVLPRSGDFCEDSESSIQSLKGVEFYKLKVQNDRQEIDFQDKLIEFVVALRDIEKPRLYRILNKNTKLFSVFAQVVEGVKS